MPTRKTTPKKEMPKKVPPRKTSVKKATEPVKPVEPAATLVSSTESLVSATPALEPVAPIEPVMTPVVPLPAPVMPVPPIPPMPPAQLQPLSPGDERTWSMLSHLSVLLNLVTGFAGPIVALIIYLIYKERSRYVAYQSLQALIFQLTWWFGGGIITALAWTISGMLSAVIIGLCLMPIACVISLLPLGAIIYGIVGGVQTSQGQDFKYWLIGDWVRGTLKG